MCTKLCTKSMLHTLLSHGYYVFCVVAGICHFLFILFICLFVCLWLHVSELLRI